MSPNLNFELLLLLVQGMERKKERWNVKDFGHIATLVYVVISM